MERILIIGACGQIGVELTLALRAKYGNENVFAADIREENPLLAGTGPFAILDVMDAEATRALVRKEKITTIYLLAALLSATGEKDPKLCWNLNIPTRTATAFIPLKFRCRLLTENTKLLR
ncbi:MAG: L-threonine 3-dehydrogenase [Candidatus Nomurabacteria bacterium GW2011_GWF1_42_40]|nr:MAG: L-threonine 3-dehydrogenase [Candidatus Nomurabacteria bacterium GW2011_GWF1_42_40]